MERQARRKAEALPKSTKAFTWRMGKLELQIGSMAINGPNMDVLWYYTYYIKLILKLFRTSQHLK